MGSMALVRRGSRRLPPFGTAAGNGRRRRCIKVDVAFISSTRSCNENRVSSIALRAQRRHGREEAVLLSSSASQGRPPTTTPPRSSSPRPSALTSTGRLPTMAPSNPTASFSLTRHCTSPYLLDEDAYTEHAAGPEK